MKIWEVQKAEPAHIPWVADNMREADVREVWASSRFTPAQALETSLSSSTMAWTCLVDGIPTLMWGAARRGCILSETGVPWLLGTDSISRVSRAFVRHSRGYVARMQEEFPYLENHVHAENILSMRWLRWCGFLIDDEPTVINQEAFFRFWRNAECAQ